MMAEPSVMVSSFFPITKRVINHSKNNDATIEVTVRARGAQPKKMTEAISAGMSAMITSYILRSMESCMWTWGDGETSNLAVVSDMGCCYLKIK